MFQDKNTNDKKSNQENFGSSMAPMSPIHLMKNDLEEIKNPRKETPQNSSEQQIKQPANLSEKQKTSPFFNPTKQPEIIANKPKEEYSRPAPVAPAPIEKPAPAPIVTPIVPPEPVKEIKREAPQKIETSVFSQQKNIKKDLPKKSVENFALNKIIIVFAVFFFLLIVGASGYYFWIVRQNKAQPEISQAPIVQPENQTEAPKEPEVKKEKLIEFSTEKPNYFTIDIATADKDSISKQIDVYLKRAEDLKITSPVEFIFTDSSNNPLPFKIFAGKIGITLSDQVLASLKDTFSFFIYNDNDNYRLGISVDSANEAATKAAMLKEEANLITALGPILKNPENKDLLKQEKYSLNVYNKANIRYANIVSPEYLSIDYAIFQKKLVITTTKNMSRAIVDYLVSAINANPTKESAVPEKNTSQKETEPQTEQPQQPLPAVNK